MNFPKVSVIIPAYNAEDTIQRCIGSIVDQNYSNLECLIIDDGSEDKTSELSCELSTTYDFIKYIRTENRGVSHARNTGIDKATGDYLIFLDADDYLCENSIISRVNSMMESVLVIGEYCLDDVSQRVIPTMRTEISDISEFLEDLFYEKKFGYQGYIWNKMFSTSIIRTHNLRFNESIFYNEDRLFVYEYVLKCEKVIFVPECIYCYVQNNNSAMASVRKNIYNSKQITELHAFLMMLEKNTSLNIKNAIRFACYMGCVRILSRMPSNEKWEQDRVKVKSLRNKALGIYFLTAWRPIEMIYKLRMIKRLLVWRK